MILEIPANLIDEVAEALEERAEHLRELERQSGDDHISETVWKGLADGLYALAGKCRNAAGASCGICQGEGHWREDCPSASPIRPQSIGDTLAGPMPGAIPAGSQPAAERPS